MDLPSLIWDLGLGEPLLSLQAEDVRVSVRRQEVSPRTLKPTDAPSESWARLDAPGSLWDVQERDGAVVSAGLLDPIACRSSQAIMGNRRIVYGVTVPGAVQAQARARRGVSIPVQVESGVFAFVAPLDQDVTVTLRDSRSRIVWEHRLPAGEGGFLGFLGIVRMHVLAWRTSVWIWRQRQALRAG